MNLNTAKKKLEEGSLSLDKAGSDTDLLGLALTKIHAALEDACRLWLSVPQVAQQHQLDVQDRSQVSWKELPDLMSRYYQWTREDMEYVRHINIMRNQAAHGEGFQGTRQDVENYKNYVANLINEDREPVSQNMSNNYQYYTQTEKNNNSSSLTLPTQKNIALAYGLWCLGFFGLFGIHRFYLGKPLTGILWLFSGGLFFIGHIIDLFLIPSMIEENNQYVQKLASFDNKLPGMDVAQQLLNKLDQLDRNMQKTLVKSQPAAVPPTTAAPTSIQKLLAAAKNNGNVLSVGQAVMMTGLPPDEVQKLLDQAIRTEIAHIGNDPESGAVRYYFDL